MSCVSEKIQSKKSRRDLLQCIKNFIVGSKENHTEIHQFSSCKPALYAIVSQLTYQDGWNHKNIFMGFSRLSYIHDLANSFLSIQGCEQFPDL